MSQPKGNADGRNHGMPGYINNLGTATAALNPSGACSARAVMTTTGVLEQEAAAIADIQTQCFVEKQSGPCRSADCVNV